MDWENPSVAKGIVPVAFYDSDFVEKSSLTPQRNVRFMY